MLSKFHAIVAARRAKEGDKGFTLIELLVVVLIIGILAAIAIPVFLGQQNSAKDAAAKSDISNIKLAVVGYFAAGNAATASPYSLGSSQLANYGYAATGTNTPAVFASDAQNFCISETSATGSTFKLLSSATATSGAITSGSSCTSVTG